MKRVRSWNNSDGVGVYSHHGFIPTYNPFRDVERRIRESAEKQGFDADDLIEKFGITEVLAKELENFEITHPLRRKSLCPGE